MSKQPTDGVGPSLSVTIVSHENRDEVRRCLEALRARPYTKGPMQIVVVDNASADGSAEMVAARYPEVDLVPSTTRQGFGANQNRAVREATGDVLFVLNPDAEVHPGTIDRLVEALGWADDVVAAGGPVLNSDGSFRQHAPQPAMTPWSKMGAALGLQRLRDRRPWGDRVFARGWLSGGGFVIERSAFESVGGFDEGFFMYAEDVDLFARLSADHYRFAWVASGGLTHPFPDEGLASIDRRAVEMVRSELRYADKHFGFAGRIVTRGAIIVHALVRLAVGGMASNVVQSHGRSRAALRSLHVARLRAAIRPYAREGLAEAATRWNGANQT
jgi:N-acetylglucosaminyl-diphospho-decaprenol L-rhamnosyltransferase